MEQFSGRTLDELGRLSLHGELRQRLGLDTGDKVSLTLVGTIIVLQRIEGDTEPGYAVSQVSDLGVIDLPCEYRQSLGWKEKDKIAMFHTDKMIILKAA